MLSLLQAPVLLHASAIYSASGLIGCGVDQTQYLDVKTIAGGKIQVAHPRSGRVGLICVTIDRCVQSISADVAVVDALVAKWDCHDEMQQNVADVVAHPDERIWLVPSSCSSSQDDELSLVKAIVQELPAHYCKVALSGDSVRVSMGNVDPALPCLNISIPFARDQGLTAMWFRTCTPTWPADQRPARGSVLIGFAEPKGRVEFQSTLPNATALEPVSTAMGDLDTAYVRKWMNEVIKHEPDPVALVQWSGMAFSSAASSFGSDSWKAGRLDRQWMGSKAIFYHDPNLVFRHECINGGAPSCP